MWWFRLNLKEIDALVEKYFVFANAVDKPLSKKGYAIIYSMIAAISTPFLVFGLQCFFFLICSATIIVSAIFVLILVETHVEKKAESKMMFLIDVTCMIQRLSHQMDEDVLDLTFNCSFCDSMLEVKYLRTNETMVKKYASAITEHFMTKHGAVGTYPFFKIPLINTEVPSLASDRPTGIIDK